MEKSASEEAKARMVEKSTKSKVISRASDIISKHFSEAVKEKEEEINRINASIVEGQKTLHLLRYGSVSETYSAYCQSSRESETSLHPEVKSMVDGKRPKEQAKAKIKEEEEAAVAETTLETELPGYVAPATKKQDSTCTMLEPRGHQHKVKLRFVVGNVSKWIECDQREDSSTHKWMIYVRGCKDRPDVSDVVKKVRFFIHQTYHPNNVVDVCSQPFHLIRRGWGEFTARIQMHFRNPANKPVDVMHNLKLDKTYTGLQTLGAETVVDVWLYAATGEGSVGKKPPPVEEVKEEPVDENEADGQKAANLTIPEDPITPSNKRSMVNGAGVDSEPEKKRLVTKVDENCSQNKLSLGDSPVSIFKTKESIQSMLKPGASLLKKLH